MIGIFREIGIVALGLIITGVMVVVIYAIGVSGLILIRKRKEKEDAKRKEDNFKFK